MCKFCDIISAPNFEEQLRDGSVISRITHLNVHKCPLITGLLDELVNVDYLNIGCTRVAKIPETLTKLKVLNAHKTPVSEVPATLTALTDLVLEKCRAITELPDTLTQLRLLNIAYTAIDYVPETFTLLSHLMANRALQFTALPATFTLLRHVHIAHTGVTWLPRELIHVKTLNISHTDIFMIPSTYTQLESVRMSNTRAAATLIHDLRDKPLLKSLKADKNSNLILFSADKGDFPALQTLNLRNCSSLREISAVPSVTELDVLGSAIQTLPTGFSNLLTLNVGGCSQLKSLPDDLTGLINLSMFETPLMTALPPTLTNLSYLSAYVSGLFTVPATLTDLRHLDVNFCANFNHVPDTLVNLGSALFCDTKITRIPATLTKLTKLSCWRCPWLVDLPDFPVMMACDARHNPLLFRFRLTDNPGLGFISLQSTYFDRYCWNTHVNRFRPMMLILHVQRVWRERRVYNARLRVAALQLWRHNLDDVRENIVHFLLAK